MSVQVRRGRLWKLRARRRTLDGENLSTERSSLSASEGLLGAGASRSAVTDASGAYTLFDVPDGTVTVRGYAADLQLQAAGPTLQSGMYYQFKATSYRSSGGGKPPGPISSTEDLRGVFVVD